MLIISVLCCILFLVEGAMLDLVRCVPHHAPSCGTGAGRLGYAAFAATMTLGRLNGDRFVQALGGARVCGSDAL